MSDRASRPEEPARRERVLRRLTAILVAIAVVWLLRTADTVFLPLAFAVFLIGLFWPLQRRLQRRLPTTAAMLLTLTVFLLVAGGFGWALAESFGEVAETAPRYQDQLAGMVEGLRQRLGMPSPGGAGLDQRLQEFALAQSRHVVSLLGGVVLVVAYFVLGLLEVLDFGHKLEATSRAGDDRAWREPLSRIARDFQAYMGVRTVVGLLTGVGAGLAAWLIGLDFALLWGVLNFLLNYIPTLGSIFGILPPVLFAAVQGGWSLALLALATIGGVQLVMGMFVDPRLQGRRLRLSPLVVLVSVALWEWIWGIPGAFIGVPMTVGIVIACARFDSTRWIAVLLADVDDEGEPEIAATTAGPG